MKRLDGISMDLTEENLNKLKDIFPDVFEEGKIDFEKLRLILGDNIEDKEEKYEFTWNGKRDAIRIAQIPSEGTLRLDKESSKNWNDTKNLYIEGDNLEVLKLLQKSYYGKIKMIYIDPPYNTGKDFVYKDNFRDNITNYKDITSQTTRANPETNGRYHTDWLNMMYPRLKLARNLLTDDGVIFISIDENEVANLRKVCDEIFGEDNLLGLITVINNLSGRSDDAYFATCNEFFLTYAKNKYMFSMKGFQLTEEELEENYDKQDSIGYYKLIGLRKTGTAWERKHRPYMYYPILINENNEISTITESEYYKIYDDINKKFNDLYIEELKQSYIAKGFKFILPIDSNGNLGRWRWGYHRFLQEKDINIELNFSGSVCSKMRANLEDGSVRLKTSKTTWYKPEYGTGVASNTLKKLFNSSSSIFEFSKSHIFIKDIIEISNLKSNDIVLDFFSGSSTTANAVLQFNLDNNTSIKYIMVQLPEITNNDSEAYKAGYKNICEIGKERIRRAGDKIVSENKHKEGIENLDIGFKVFKLDSSNLKSWDSSIDDLEQNILEMETNLKRDRTNEDLLYEILLKSGVELTAKIEEIKVGYNTLYSIGEGALLACLDDKITQDVIDEIPKHKSKYMDTKVIFKEAGFMSDAAKINAIQNLKQFKIEDVRSV